MLQAADTGVADSTNVKPKFKRPPLVRAHTVTGAALRTDTGGDGFTEHTEEDDWRKQHSRKRVQRALCTAMYPQNFEPGSTVISQGTTADAMYYIQQGQVEVWVSGEQVATMSAGESFGERSLLSPIDEKRSATIKTSQDSGCTVLVLTRKSFVDLVCLHFEDMDVLLTELKIATTRDYVMDEHVRMTLTRLCQRVLLKEEFDYGVHAKEYPPDSNLVVEGELADAMFVIITGSCQVVVDGVMVHEMGDGDFFGEGVVLERYLQINAGTGPGEFKKRTATVRAATHCTAMRLSPQEFAKIAAAHPEIVEEV